MGSILSSLASVRKRFSDTFNRADQTGIGTASDGSTWQSINGRFDIVGNKAVGSSSSYPIAAVDFPQKNVSIDLAGISQGASAALWVTDSGNWWAVGIDQVPETCNCQTCQDIVGYDYSNVSCTPSGYVGPQQYCDGYYAVYFIYCAGSTYIPGNCKTYTNGGGTCKAYTNAGGNCSGYNTVNSFCSYQYSTGGNCKGYNAYNAKNKTGGNCIGYNAVTYVCGVYGNSGGTCKGYNAITSSCSSYNAITSTCNAWNADYYNCDVPIYGGGDCIVAYNSAYCNSFYSPNAVYGSPYSCNCQTCYPQYIRIMQSVGSTVSQIASWVISGVAQSLKVKTSGDQITIKAYSDPSLITQIDSDIVYTPTGAAVNSKFGIAIKPSSYNQGYTIDQVTIDKN